MKQNKVIFEKYSSLSLLVIISISIIFRIYHSGQKKIYHVDELSSFQIINRTYANSKEVQKFKDKWMTGSDYIDSFFTIKKENLKKDIKFLLRNTKDSPHPNLYYIALRLTLSKGIRGVDGLFKYYGIGLNIFIYSIGAFFLYLLYMNIYIDKKCALLAVFLYSISLGAISNSLFIRMYEFLSTFIIITTFLVFRMIDKDKPTLFDYCLLYVAFTIGYLTHYYYTVFLIFLIFVIFYHYMIRRQLIYFLYYCITTIQGFITAQAIYPKFIFNFKSYRANEVYSKINLTKLLNNITIKIKTTYELITHNIVYFLLIIIFSILILFIYHLIKKNKKIINLKELYLFFISLSFSIFVIYISPFESARYLFGVLALLIVIPIMFIRILPIKSLKIIMVMVFCFIYIYYNFNPVCIKKTHMGSYIYPSAERNIDRLFFRSNSATPVYFFSSKHWMRGLVVAYFKKDQKYKLLTDKEPILNFNETGSKDLFLIIEKDNREKTLKEQIKNSNWFIKNQVNYIKYKIIYIKKLA
jgi:hypothetical protein